MGVVLKTIINIDAFEIGEHQKNEKMHSYSLNMNL